MRHRSLSAFLDHGRAGLDPGGPCAVILLEDSTEVQSTIAHAQRCGFQNVLVAGAQALLPDIDPEAGTGLHLIAHEVHDAGAMTEVVNPLIDVLAGRWIHYCFNAEYLHFPFCESRSVGELTRFCNEERRASILTYVVDLYARDLVAHPDGVNRHDAHFDSAGYYALQRSSGAGEVLNRQLDVFGGLRWRFEEHVPWTRRRIDRVGLFRAAEGLRLHEDHSFNQPEYNTFACAWHHNVSATICSFRTAKALMTNPGSKHAITNFAWRNSERFDWTSSQLMELGLMEPGQWF